MRGRLSSAGEEKAVEGFFRCFFGAGAGSLTGGEEANASQGTWEES